MRRLAQQYVISTFAGIANVSGYYGDGGPATSGNFLPHVGVALIPKAICMSRTCKRT